MKKGLFKKKWPLGNVTLGFHAAQAISPDQYQKQKEKKA